MDLKNFYKQYIKRVMDILCSFLFLVLFWWLLVLVAFLVKNRHKAQRKAKFYINKCRSASCMQGGLKQASA